MHKTENGEFFDTSIMKLKEPGEKLEAGVRCHDFFIRTVDDRGFELSTFARQKVWIALYRYAGCPLCAPHYSDVLELKAKLQEADVVFIAVFDCAKDQIPQGMRRLEEPNYLVVADENQTLFDMFGAEKSWQGLVSPATIGSRVKAGLKGYSEEMIGGSFNRMPAHFLIYPGGEVAHAHYAKNAADHISWKTVWDFVKESTAERNQLRDTQQRAATENATSATNDKKFEMQAESSTNRHFVVFYQWQVKAGFESEFCRIWKALHKKVAETYPGSHGASLHLGVDGNFYAYAKWENQSDWQQFWVTKEQKINEVRLLRSCLEESYPPLFLQPIVSITQARPVANSEPSDADSATEIMEKIS
jgi:peroxiredoxin Q/BCP